MRPAFTGEIQAYEWKNPRAFEFYESLKDFKKGKKRRIPVWELIRDSPMKSCLPLTLEPGKNYFVWQKVKMGLWFERRRKYSTPWSLHF